MDGPAGLDQVAAQVARVTDQLAAAGVDNARQEARWLVEEAASRPVSLDALVARRAAGEPVQYVLGHWSFRTLELAVDRRVLIPRPETEVVCGYALDEIDRVAGDLAGREETVKVVDLGTGSGALALAVATERPATEVWAVERSSAALDVAGANLATAGAAGRRVELSEGSWFEALPRRLRGQIHVIVSNPPYVGADEQLPASVRDWEPVDALVPQPGATGLEALEVILASAPRWLAPGGAVVIEIGAAQGPTATELATAAGFSDVAVRPDLAGRPRALVARLEGEGPDRLDRA
ncbi:MAG TPA: peptide chain release factor N(5)-glutamine methyltransferase [Acidimicrobiales bacterium]|jgi:release factor glutamine methyltransferase|nr:peptide chain release factor N(5)-glutamine methyltransferase [Acidimicrobiales bacterium]